MADTLGKASAIQAVTGKGMVLYYGTGDDIDTAVWTKIEGITSIGLPSPSKSDIEVTTTEDTTKAYIPGLAEMSDLSAEANYYPNNSVHRYIMDTLAYEDSAIPWKIEGPYFTVYFYGSLKTIASTGSPDAKMTMNMTIKVSTKPDYEYKDDITGAIAYDSTLTGTYSTGAVTGSVLATFTPASGVSATYATGVTGTFTAGTHYTIANVPAGLTAVLTKTSGTVATLTFTGTATAKDDVTDIALTFKDAAFSGVVASGVTGAAKSNIAITFA